MREALHGHQRVRCKDWLAFVSESHGLANRQPLSVDFVSLYAHVHVWLPFCVRSNARTVTRTSS